MGNASSSLVVLDFILSPLLFCIYILPLRHGKQTQNPVTLLCRWHSNLYSINNQREGFYSSCILSVRSCCNNSLQPPRVHPCFTQTSLILVYKCQTCSQHLAVMYDRDFSFEKQITKVVQCFYQLRSIWNIRSFLSWSTFFTDHL